MLACASQLATMLRVTNSFEIANESNMLLMRGSNHSQACAGSAAQKCLCNPFMADAIVALLTWKSSRRELDLTSQPGSGDLSDLAAERVRMPVAALSSCGLQLCC